jgi:predicted nucleotidyltransferase
LTFELVEQAKEHLRDWAAKVFDNPGAQAIYAFGSLVYRDGSQFGIKSDIDLIVIMPEIADALDRATWLGSLLAHKAALEDTLGKLLRRTDRSAVLCSVVTASSIEVAANIHKDGAADFFSANQFLDLGTGELVNGLPGAGRQKVAERLVGECLRFAQKTRNAYLAVNALGDTLLMPFDDQTDAAPKALMRHAAMIQHLTDDGDGDPGAEYDLDVGADQLTALVRERRKQLSDLSTIYAARRGGRAARQALSVEHQLILTEMIFDAAIQVEAQTAALAAQPKRPKPSGAHSTVVFAERFAAAFPGVRGIEWFDDQADIRQRLAELLTSPLEFESSTPVWWSRGSSSMPISDFAEAAECILIDGNEMKVSRVAAVNQGSYKYNFVYLQVEPLPPTGLYHNTANRIAETARGESPFPYYWEEYGIVDGTQLITRAEYDDGSAMIGGQLQKLQGRSEVRGRYVTPYNLVIAAAGSPLLDRSNDEKLGEHLNAMLRGEDRLAQLAAEAHRLPAGRY